MVVTARQTAAPPSFWRKAGRRVAAGADYLFGPPRVREEADGSVSVRLLGRRFESATREGLFDAVGHERERLVEGMGKLHAGAAMRPLAGSPRMGDAYHREAVRLQDRIGLYSEFLGRLAKELDGDGPH